MSRPSATRDSRRNRDTYGRETISGSVISPLSYDTNHQKRIPRKSATPSGHVQSKTTTQNQQKAPKTAPQQLPSIKVRPGKIAIRNKRIIPHVMKAEAFTPAPKIANPVLITIIPAHTPIHRTLKIIVLVLVPTTTSHFLVTAIPRDNNTSSRGYRSHNNDYYTRRKDNSSHHTMYQYLSYPDITEAGNSDASSETDFSWPDMSDYDIENWDADLDSRWVPVLF
ncbi:hypothetical protein GGR51DRAFT_554855 [Nemania sp. FL0031]|nr:hypothetical protein GGR51DRAFT_554855 [Nemania sp. FL0031]